MYRYYVMCGVPGEESRTSDRREPEASQDRADKEDCVFRQEILDVESTAEPGQVSIAVFRGSEGNVAFSSLLGRAIFDPLAEGAQDVQAYDIFGPRGEVTGAQIRCAIPGPEAK